MMVVVEKNLHLKETFDNDYQFPSYLHIFYPVLFFLIT
ncbi:hypothetical protein KKC1_14380 [Calderihabitans maritimus]|uniref:Uncharacterized protein n=1 Tax=Calderihabitans maritimus TaxID=1246530 RepID=A0A1Z5HRY1_9FIRM|nr:hypothetical protein KKC1_14380 [Calderihabitans maritimus]